MKNDRRLGWVQKWIANLFAGVRFPRLSPEKVWRMRDAAYWRAELKAKAFNKRYKPPKDEWFLAQAVIVHLYHKQNKTQEALIEARKELTRMKRNDT